MGMVVVTEGSGGPHNQDTCQANTWACWSLPVAVEEAASCNSEVPWSPGQGGRLEAMDLHHHFICSLCSRRHPKLKELWNNTTQIVPRLYSLVLQSLHDALERSSWQPLTLSCSTLDRVWLAEALEEAVQCHHSMGGTLFFTCATGGHTGRSYWTAWRKDMGSSPPPG